ncbi:unnamed protein product, partial [Didymodactylos carnosus]
MNDDIIKTLQFQITLLEQKITFHETIIDLQKTTITSLQKVVEQSSVQSKQQPFLQNVLENLSSTITLLNNKFEQSSSQSTSTNILSSQNSVNILPAQPSANILPSLNSVNQPLSSQSTTTQLKSQNKKQKHCIIGDSLTSHIDKRKLQTNSIEVEIRSFPRNGTIENISRMIYEGRLDNVLSSSKSSTFVIGTNNFTVESPNSAIDKTKNLVHIMKKYYPKCEIILTKVPPRLTESIDENLNIQESIQSFNTQLEDLSSELKFRSIDSTLTLNDI